GHQRRVDDRPDAGAVGRVVVAEVEAQQAVDLVLVQDAFGTGGGGHGGGGLLLGPGGAQVGQTVGVEGITHCTSISSISTASTWPGAAIRLTRRRISMRS